MVAALIQQNTDTPKTLSHRLRACTLLVVCLSAASGNVAISNAAMAQDNHRNAPVYSSAIDEELEGTPEPTALFRQAESVRNTESVRRQEAQPARRRPSVSGDGTRETKSAVTPASYSVDDSTDADSMATETTQAERGDDQPFLDLTSDLDSQTGRSKSRSAASESADPIIRTLATCVIVGCLSILVILGLRRWQRSRGLLPGAGGRSRVIETLSLGPGRTVSLIEMDGIRALVGADSGGIRTIVMAPRGFSEELAEQQGTDLSSLNL